MGGSRPKKPQASASERELARVALLRHGYEKSNIRPLLIAQRDYAMNYNFQQDIRGRNITTASQALTGELTYDSATNVTSLGDTATAYASTKQQAEEQALQEKTSLSAAVISAGQRQGAHGLEGLSHAAQLETTTAVTEVAAKQAERSAALAAGVQIASAVGLGWADKKQREHEAAVAAAKEKKTKNTSTEWDMYDDEMYKNPKRARLRDPNDKSSIFV